MSRTPIAKIFLCSLIVATAVTTIAQTSTDYTEDHRPQIHFSPKKSWMNDPNGMVFYKGTYHLFFQYYPDSTVWGPMHWGHATSTDLIHWQEQPIALYPDSLGYIFSGSAVVDEKNTSGFGKNGQTPLVAIFTHHDPKGEGKRKDYQNQSIAYSLDSGKTWTKYEGNPVVKNPGIVDFRDPKVSWYDKGKKWIMTLATKDRITFYSSKDLKSWEKESEFGAEVGAHGGVWECPDLFPLTYRGKKVWILFVSINPGAPFGGSGTQYFVGDFDGTTFTPFDTDLRWIDYGRDNYAGVTWSNTGDRKIFLGWMSNWQYAERVPTKVWRSATTIPRELGLEKIEDKYMLTFKPVKELQVIEDKPVLFAAAEKKKPIGETGKLTFNFNNAVNFSITLSNELGEKIEIGYDMISNQYYINRTGSGKSTFSEAFPGRVRVPRFTNKIAFDVTLIIDRSSIEFFADNGLSVMTDIYFPHKPYSQVEWNIAQASAVKDIIYTPLKRIW